MARVVDEWDYWTGGWMDGWIDWLIGWKTHEWDFVEKGSKQMKEYFNLDKIEDDNDPQIHDWLP